MLALYNAPSVSPRQTRPLDPPSTPPPPYSVFGLGNGHCCHCRCASHDTHLDGTESSPRQYQPETSPGYSAILAQNNNVTSQPFLTPRTSNWLSKGKQKQSTPEHDKSNATRTQKTGNFNHDDSRSPRLPTPNANSQDKPTHPVSTGITSILSTFRRGRVLLSKAGTATAKAATTTVNCTCRAFHIVADAYESWFTEEKPPEEERIAEIEARRGKVRETYLNERLQIVQRSCEREREIWRKYHVRRASIDEEQRLLCRGLDKVEEERDKLYRILGKLDRRFMRADDRFAWEIQYGSREPGPCN